MLWGNGSKVISNGRNTYGENRIFITGSGEIYDLEIRSVTIYDDGVYICQVPSAGITIRNTLTVNGKTRTNYYNNYNNNICLFNYYNNYNNNTYYLFILVIHLT